MDSQPFNLRDEVLAPYLPDCEVGCPAISAEIDMLNDVITMSCPHCKQRKEHKINKVPDIVFKILYVDFLEPVSGIN